MRVVIIGAGIGGLTAAIALEQRGHEVVVVERSDSRTSDGSAIGLGQNALAALERLGALEAIRARSRVNNGRRVFDWKCRPLSNGPYGGAALRRADVRAAFVSHLNTTVQYGRAAVEVEQDERRATVHFSDGSVESADVLIAADGLRSAIRAQLFSDGAPLYRGTTSFRGIAPIAHELFEHQASESWGRAQRFGVSNLGSGWAYWWADFNAPQGSLLPASEGKQMLLRRYAAWHEPIPAVIQATNVADLVQTEIFDRDPLPHWAVGRIALAGDAAHPMTPDLAQGAAQAIEDSLVLGEVLTPDADPVAALIDYERRRMPAAYDILARARRFNRIARWENPLAIALRNEAVRHMPSAVAMFVGIRRQKN